MILGAKKYTATRAAAGSWSDGEYTPGASSSFAIKGSMQPMNSDEISLLPEGAREQAAWILLCDMKQTELALADHVARDGRDYLVLHVYDWSDHGVLPYRSYALGEVTNG